MNALFVGRFQPFHNGHLQLIESISKNYDKIIIAIGSTQYQNTNQNPFSFYERKYMITKTLKNYNITNFEIFAVPDIHDLSKWVDHVSKIISDFDVVLTNNSLTTQLFKDKGYSVKKTKLYDRNNFSGKNIREKIINGDNFKNLVPEFIYNYLIKINASERLKKINRI